MHTKTLATGCALLFFILSIPTSSTWAVELGQLYQGKIKCKVYNDQGSKRKVKQALTVAVNQSPIVDNGNGVSNLNVGFSFFGEGGLANATLFDDANNPDTTGAAGGVLCANNGNANDLNAVFDFVVRKSGKKLKGTASFTSEGLNGVCKWKAKDTDQSATVDPCGP